MSTTTRLTEAVEAFCPRCHTLQHLAPGEFWPAWCECGDRMHETGISRNHREQSRQDFEALVDFAMQMTRQDARFLSELRIAI